jgi:hypothetical protein
MVQVLLHLRLDLVARWVPSFGIDRRGPARVDVVSDAIYGVHILFFTDKAPSIGADQPFGWALGWVIIIYIRSIVVGKDGLINQLLSII